MEYNFLKYDLNKIDHLGASYDTCSVMHYGAYAFSKVGSSGSLSLFFALSFSQFQFLSLYPIVYLAYPILFLSLYVSISLMYSSLSLFPYLSGLDKRIIYDLCGTPGLLNKKKIHVWEHSWVPCSFSAMYVILLS